MTSQIVVFNMTTLAVASDTAVTTSDQFGDKVLVDYSKFFEFGGQHKVLTMMNGLVLLNGRPVQYLLGDWARNLKVESIAHVRQYPESFVEYLKIVSLSPESQALLAMGRLEAWFDSWDESLTREVIRVSPNRWLPVDEDGALKVDPNYYTQLADILFTFFTDQVALLEDLERIPQKELDGFDDWFRNDPVFRSHLERRLKEFLPVSSEITVERYPDDLRKLLDEMIRGCLLLNVQSDEDFCEFVFMGLGHEDSTPAVAVLQIAGKYGGVLIAKHQSSIPGDSWSTSSQFEVDDYQPARLMSFAQDDAMLGFLNETSPTAIGELSSAIEKVLDEIFESWVDKTLVAESQTSQEDFVAHYRSEITASVRTLNDSWLTAELQSSFSTMGPVGLVDFVKSMIKVQELATYKTPGSATVAGEIEVATIDARHGIRWHQRLPIPN
jgi:hypothetical protein